MGERSSDAEVSRGTSRDGSPSLRLGAYVMLADPAFLEQSIRSYYDIVEFLVVVYDEAALSWTGKPLPIDELLGRVESLDTDGKVTLLPGAFHDAAKTALESETHERNIALAALDGKVDWVLQIDTDEVLANPARFVEAIGTAHDAGRSALHYPARWIYAQVRDDLYLERCRRLWGIAAGYPGAVAVRTGTELSLARQCKVPTWRVDFRRRNTDPAHDRGTTVNEVVRPEDTVWHFSWVRSEQEMRAKSTTSGHVHDFDWDREIDSWMSRSRHPYRTMLLTPVRRRPDIVGGPTWLRTVRIPDRILEVGR